jgi:hypothetical protein
MCNGYGTDMEPNWNGNATDLRQECKGQPRNHVARVAPTGSPQTAYAVCAAQTEQHAFPPSAQTLAVTMQSEESPALTPAPSPKEREKLPPVVQ